MLCGPYKSVEVVALQFILVITISITSVLHPDLKYEIQILVKRYSFYKTAHFGFVSLS